MKEGSRKKKGRKEELMERRKLRKGIKKPKKKRLGSKKRQVR